MAKLSWEIGNWSYISIRTFGNCSQTNVEEGRGVTGIFISQPIKTGKLLYIMRKMPKEWDLKRMTVAPPKGNANNTIWKPPHSMHGSRRLQRMVSKHELLFLSIKNQIAHLMFSSMLGAWKALRVYTFTVLQVVEPGRARFMLSMRAL